MINVDSLKADWIKKVSTKQNNADKILIEKSIRALYLLEQLVLTDLDFIFKGGTSLLLLLNDIKRLSIDIDIIIPEKIDLTANLNKIIETTDFIRWETNERKAKSRIEKSHYKLYYYPSINNTRSEEEYILLDVVFETNPYKEAICQTEISSPILITEGKTSKVTTPLIDAILGDKLTAFAPNTTGISYGIGKEIEIIKQMYDIACLIDVATDVKIIAKTFKNIAQTEIEYRELKNVTPNDVLEDILQTSLCISVRGQDGICDFNELHTGIKNIVNFIISESFHIEKAITFAAKAAYISYLISTDAKEIHKFKTHDVIKDQVIKQAFNTKLNKLKKSNPEAFYYWYQAIKLINSK